MKTQMLLLSIFAVCVTVFAAPQDKWIPVNKDFMSMDINSAVLGNDQIIIGVGEYGTIKRGMQGEEFDVVRGDYEFNDLFDVISLGDKTFFAVGEYSTALYSTDNGNNWIDLNISKNEKLISAAFFNNYIYFCSENSIYKTIFPNFQIELVSDEFFGINKLHSTGEKLYIIGQNGLIAVYDESSDTFNELSVNTSENISEIISRENKTILFPNKEQPIITEDSFENTKRLESSNPMYFVKAAAWLSDSLIVAIANNNDAGPFHHTFTSDMAINWVMGGNPIVPTTSLTGYNEQALLTGSYGTIILINKDFNKSNFSFFSNILTIGYEPFRINKLKIIDKSIFGFGHYYTISSDIDSFVWERHLSDHQGVIDALFDDDISYFIKRNSVFKNGRNYYENFIIKSSNSELDTVFKTKLSNFLLDHINEVNGNIIAYGNIDTLIVKRKTSNDFEKIILPDYLSELKIDNGVLHCLFNTETDFVYRRTTDLGNSFSDEFVLPGNGSIHVHNGKVFYLSSSRIGNEYKNSFYEIGESLEEIYSVRTNLYLHKIYTYNDFFLFGGRDSVYYSLDRGKSWQHEEIKHSSNTRDITGIENHVFVALSEYIYYKVFDTEVGVNDVRIENGLNIYPNPASENTTIRYSIEKPEIMQITLFNINGKKIDIILESQYLPAGEKTIDFNIGHLPSGSYLLLFEIGDKYKIEKFQVVK